MKHFVLLLILQIAFSVQAQNLYINNDYKHFFNVVQEEARKGNVVAIKEMGDMYNWGNNYSSSFTGLRDYHKAMEYYMLAASYGYPYAQWEIARMYFLGKGVESDKEKNIEWLEKAFENFKIYAEKGDVKAMDHLVDYYTGIEGDNYKDYTKAVYWAFREAESGYPSGASHLASLYCYGHGVKKDATYGYIWQARFCVEAKKLNWPVEQYPNYNDLKAAGFSTADWDRLSAFTYGFHIPHVSVNDEEGISNAVKKILNYFSSKHSDIVATVSSNFPPTRNTDYQSQNTLKKKNIQKRLVNRQNSNENSSQLDRNYATPPIVNNIYFKHKSGVAVKLRIWKKENYSSGDANIDSYLNSLFKSTYGEDSGWGFELSPGWVVNVGTKLQITNNYFELKQLQRGITTTIKVARDLSWVSGYDSMAGTEIVFDKRASKKEYDAWCKAHKNLYNQIQYGGSGNYSSSGTTNNGSSGNYGNSSSSGRTYNTCKYCGGSGTCSSCHGSGGEWRDTGYYTGSDSKSWINCPSCRGSKRCFNCHGTGRF